MTVSSQEPARIAKAAANKSALVGAQGVKPQERVRDDLVALEYEALSLLLLHWAQPPDGSSRWMERRDKLPLFRAAVIGGKGSGGKEACPAELVLDEYAVVLEAAAWLKDACPHRNDPAAIVDWLHEHHSKYRCESLGGALARPLPIPPTLADELAAAPSGRVTLTSGVAPLAREITARRLGVSPSTVKNKLAEEASRRWTATLHQRHLASLFIDLSTRPPNQETDHTRAMVLNALYVTGYWIIQIAYLVQMCHRHPAGRDLSFGTVDTDAVLVSCDTLIQGVTPTRTACFVTNEAERLARRQHRLTDS